MNTKRRVYTAEFRQEALRLLERSGKRVADVEQFGIQVSLSRAHNCFDNAPMESFWGKLKTECLYRHHFTTRVEARTPIFAYLEGFCNRQRLHSTLGYLSLEQFEQAVW